MFDAPIDLSQFTIMVPMDFVNTIPDVYSVPNGMPREVFENKYSRVKSLVENPLYDASKPEGKANRKMKPVYQNWEERITDVVYGNLSLDPRVKTITEIDTVKTVFDTLAKAGTPAISVSADFIQEFQETLRLSKQGVMAYSGRHLQHGDINQRNKLGELFTNCSTAMFSWALFKLLLKGSGVGRDYTSDLHWVDWNYLPECRFVLEGPDQFGFGGHPDYEPWIESLQAAKHKYDSESEKVRWFEVEDSAEGWVKVITILETACFHKNNKDHLFIFDFSKVRKALDPIKGQQNRPSSGPVPLILALHKIMTIKGAGMKPWKQAMFVDDALAACVVVGGIRRSSRMATKHWRDKDVLEFADIKREGFLRTANNSILVDKVFWSYVHDAHNRTADAVHARRVFAAASEAALMDETGEPGLINVDMLTWSNAGMDTITPETYIDKFYAETMLGLHPKTMSMIAYVLNKAKAKSYCCIVNPCAEIVLAVYGGYCIVGDVCGTWARTLLDFLNGCRLMARALMRVNLMRMMYGAEVRRTNRIGVGMIGIQELAWNHFGLNLKHILWADFDVTTDDMGNLRNVATGEVLDKDIYQRSLAFKSFIEFCAEEVERSANEFADEHGMTRPHTYTTTKPAGTGAKVMNSTEAANAPTTPTYLRNNQYHIEDPQYWDLRRRGYPWRDVSAQYPQHHVIGFPTKQLISDIMGDNVVTSEMMSPREQYSWLRWLEAHWLLGLGRNNQISYTMKYVGEKTTLDEFRKLMIEEQSTVRCCSWMRIADPDELAKKFAYLPEEPITYKKFRELRQIIDDTEAALNVGTVEAPVEEVTDDQLQCESGVCPIERDQFVDVNGKPIEDTALNGTSKSYSDEDLQCESGVCPIERDQLVFVDGRNVTDEDLDGDSTPNA